MEPLSSEFLANFNKIEQWLRREVDAPESKEFSALLSAAERKHGILNRYLSALKRFARLRNLIAHDHCNTRPLAVPTQSTVDEIKKLVELITHPPSLLSSANQKVITCQSSDPIGLCVRKMCEGNFSQLPVLHDSKFSGLLTTDTVARWLASVFPGDGQGIVEEESVSTVMKNQEGVDSFKFLDRSANIGDALAAFDTYQNKGKRLNAILITHNGNQTESLLGIVTVEDIPKLSRSLYSS